jgi:hypothetical protein
VTAQASGRSPFFWPGVVIFVFAGVAVGTAIWTHTSEHPVLLAQAAPENRSNWYSTAASNAGALLGLVIAALAVLVTLPDRPRIEVLRRYKAWSSLLWTMIATLAMLALTLVLASAGQVIDVHKEPTEWLANVATAAAVASFVGIVVSGLAFALVIVIAGKTTEEV